MDNAKECRLTQVLLIVLYLAPIDIHIEIHGSIILCLGSIIFCFPRIDIHSPIVFLLDKVDLDFRSANEFISADADLSLESAAWKGYGRGRGDANEQDEETVELHSGSDFGVFKIGMTLGRLMAIDCNRDQAAAQYLK
ncbi:hypothetical protein ONS95_007559 [Cadophora gregata]|uniref:uncharacterized protein n=1 Tax=Cadophora gregata TaxID=51156 RepID=UPI0026DD35F9|nr:uncharacterized protein ONS95_007559 [Cadophora gregata]KAK0125935.1 hypothetical protein ONS95_007559 [Cadophora gregata]